MDKMKRNQLLCGAAGILLGVLMFFSSNWDRWGPIREIGRNTYGAGGKREELIVKGLGKKAEKVTVDIDELSYDMDHAWEIFHEIRENLPDIILQENESFYHIDSSMYLPSEYGNSGVSIVWSISDKSVIDEKGDLISPAPEGSPVNLLAEFWAGDYSDSVNYQLLVFPPEDTAERKMNRFLSVLSDNQFHTQEEPVMTLPEEFEGHAITFNRKMDFGFLMFPAIGIIFGLLLPLNEKQKANDEKKKYENEMMLYYADIISKLVIFTGAGMSMRMAWEKISRDYEAEKKAAVDDSWSDKPAYEEISYAVRRMNRGIVETVAYNEFGERCRTREYRKLSSLIVQSLKNGSKGFSEALNNEMELAFEQKKNMARRLGEEASTKLMAPLMMLLAIVMMVVIVPAFISFA